ncbi:hypothetical protein SMACR_03041 [Sordaria macrospora]|uniref:WGS project CABT00000000 data, contig 2.7 n=2 Tax=Sordaria macrospora TaxID=5147 RepID=F7VUE4_SORMK|nr:uncharacterized protein SMAC_03041 [Sordaria macrospora k-hell]KAA8632455.1 hypothetical protein SMACR_03041 [Sordaria macrospora]KAH7631022.1 hypothetical protein B0T09DRAFT_408685 [Sordaria sp. MPI-SDFR-AT-0083]WPJ61875.1 hypothetical protein SMAC4_03041 [Sordaria macrospora]CCC09133.1 unnamed protein product [Sordaria macrospora k-hell]
MSSNPNQNTNPHIDDRDAQPQPGLIAGHAEYIKGAAEAAIGNITGSHAWTTSGEQDKAHAKASLQKASESRDPAASGYGSVEETAGKLTGCEWMKKEGAASKSHHE